MYCMLYKLEPIFAVVTSYNHLVSLIEKRRCHQYEMRLMCQYYNNLPYPYNCTSLSCIICLPTVLILNSLVRGFKQFLSHCTIYSSASAVSLQQHVFQPFVLSILGSPALVSLLVRKQTSLRREAKISSCRIAQLFAIDIYTATEHFAPF